MIVSWNWLKDYVRLDMSPEELENRLTMSGLNHEGTKQVADDLAIDLEVTSNRPDCLGHIGVAREVAVLWDSTLTTPAAEVKESQPSVSDLMDVSIECPDLCYRYTARVIRGIKVGPSPDWLARRLETIGIAVINNIVDISNYVLFECGQPLHAFDYAHLEGQKIIVREATAGEKFLAIDHKTYDLVPGMCVIADARRAVALAGVMGGADSEVSAGTTDLLIESAEFDPLSTRTTARRLNLHSDSSYRFERGVDPEGVDWGGRRAAELVLDLAGGELAAGVVDVGTERKPREPVVLRLDQLPRILGIEVSAAEVRKILTALGNEEVRADDKSVEVVPPSWRRDLVRGIDLVEEVARIHGYDQIPEDVGVPMVPSARSDDDRVIEQVRHVLTAAGLDEAMTISATDAAWAEAFSPWTEVEPLRCSTPVLRGANLLRRSLVPSILGARRTNETLANPRIELFEIAKVYLREPEGLPVEELMLAITSGEDFLTVKGVVEAIIRKVAPDAVLDVVDTSQELLMPGRACELRLGDETFGYLGEVSAAGLARFELRRPTAVAEVKLSVLIRLATLVPKHTPPSLYPSVARDLNIVVDEAVRWAAVAELVHASGGEHLESVDYQDTYRDAERLGGGKKSLLFSIRLRSQSGTLTREEADSVRDDIVARLADALGGQLRA